MPDHDPTGENAMSADPKTTHAAGAPTGINERAPVVGASEIDISATPEAVWEVLTAFERWPSWNPDVKSMTLHEPVAPGSGVPLEGRTRHDRVDDPVGRAAALDRLDG
jgi:hypothetical protein